MCNSLNLFLICESRRRRRRRWLYVKFRKRCQKWEPLFLLLHHHSCLCKRERKKESHAERWKPTTFWCNEMYLMWFFPKLIYAYKKYVLSQVFIFSRTHEIEIKVNIVQKENSYLIPRVKSDTREMKTFKSKLRITLIKKDEYRLALLWLIFSIQFSFPNYIIDIRWQKYKKVTSFERYKEVKKSIVIRKNYS